MISVIVCSISPSRLAALRENIVTTIGLEHEFIVIDNNVLKYSIAKAYNIGAEQARYPYLCFAHEDIAFGTQNWGQLLLTQLEKPDTGIIGFAGSIGKSRELSTWTLNHIGKRMNLYETVDDNTRKFVINPAGEDFSQVITLDGLCLIMPRRVWQEHHFDSETFDDFHLYDLDISVSVAHKYTNYVSNNVMVEHFSRGSYNNTWLEYTVKFHDKWHHSLPMYVDQPSEKQIRHNENEALRQFTFFITKRGLGKAEMIHQRIRECIKKYPFRPDSYFLKYRYLKRLKLLNKQ